MQKVKTTFYQWPHSVISNCNFFVKNNTGDSLKPEEIMSNHSVHSQVECSLKCLNEQFCVSYNYIWKSRKHEINCQTSRNTSLERDTTNVVQGQWMFYEDIENLPVSIYSLVCFRENEL